MDLNLTMEPTAITELATYYNVKRTCPNPVVHVIGVEKTKRHTYKLLLSDGLYFHGAYVDCTLKRSKQLQKGSIVRLAEYLRASVDNTTVIKLLDVNVIGTKCDIIGNPKPFPYSATSCISAEDDYHGSSSEDEHPLLNGSCSSAEDDSYGSFPEEEQPLLKGFCSSVEEQLESETETEDGFIMLENSFDYEVL